MLPDLGEVLPETRPPPTPVNDLQNRQKNLVMTGNKKTGSVACLSLLTP